MKSGMDNEIIVNSGEELDLVDFLNFLLRKYRIILAASAIGLVAALIYVLLIATPVYEATAQIYVVNSKDSALDLSDLQIGSYLTSDYQLVFNTWEVNQQVIEDLSLPYTVKQLQDMVTVTNPSNTRALFITVTSKSGAEAALVANELAYVGSRYISDTMKTDMPSILSTALTPLEPAKPQKKLIVLLGMFAGFVLSVAVLFAVYMNDDKIKNSADLMKCVGTEPLAVVPLNKAASGRKVRL